jgi:hypothetical protein
MHSLGRVLFPRLGPLCPTYSGPDVFHRHNQEPEVPTT